MRSVGRNAAHWVAIIAAALALLPAALGAEEAAKTADEEPNPCRGDPLVEPGRIDVMREGVRYGVCATARFVDRLFTGEHEFSEFEDDTNGRAGVTLGWNEHDGFDLDGRFRATVTLPELNERLNATIGRAMRDEFVADEVDSIGPVGGSFSDDDEAEWFAGLGYSVHRGRDDRFDLGAGIKLAAPLNPYVNARYRNYIYPSDRTLLTLRTTAFWENHEGFGITQGFDVDRVLSGDYLLRWGNTARISEETLGVRWHSRLALYQAIDYRRAMRYELSMRGETDGTAPDLYGLRVTHRRAMWRDWFFVEFGAALFWADGPTPADRCDACIGASVGFEFLFGEAYDRALMREARAAEKAARADPR